MNPRNQLRGKKNKAQGKLFEDIISNSCEWYSANGIAKIEKQSEPMRVIKALQGGKFVACYAGKAGVDYKGTIRGGNAVVFEAKHTETEQMQRAKVKDWQLDYLIEHKNLGAKAFVILSYGLANFYRIPVEDWFFMKQRFGRQFLREEDIQQYKLKSDGKVILFLEGMYDEQL